MKVKDLKALVNSYPEDMDEWEVLRSVHDGYALSDDIDLDICEVAKVTEAFDNFSTYEFSSGTPHHSFEDWKAHREKTGATVIKEKAIVIC